MAIYGWKLVDDSGNPVPEQNWNTPGSWVAYPVANPPVTGTVPAAGDDAFIGAGTVNVSVFGFPFVNDYAVTVDVTDSRTVSTLGLGGMSITGLNLFPTISPVFGTPTVFPTVKVTGGSLDVTGNLVDTFAGTIAIPLNFVGTQVFSGTFAGGGTIDLASKGTLEVGGTVGAGIIVDFTDGASDLLRLDGVTTATPFAFGGTIDDFRQGDTILLSSLHTATHFDFNYGVGGVLTITDDAAPAITVASLIVNTTSPPTFALNAGAGGLAITLGAPVPPAPSAPDLMAASDSGLSNSDNVTKVTAPTFSGSAEANSTVNLFDGATLVGTGKASAAGAWSITSSTLASGKHSITAKAIDFFGTSVASAALAVTVDTTAPAAPSVPDLATASDSGASSTDNITKVATPTFTGTAEVGSKITLLDGATTIGTATANGAGAWSIVSSALAQGKHAITAKTTDIAGNAGVASAALAVTIDTTAPVAPSAPDLTAASDDGVLNTDNKTSITTPVFAGTAEAGASVTLLDGAKSVGTATANALGAWTIKSSALTVGAHSITAKATDAAGNIGVASAALPVTILATHDVHWIAGNGAFDTVADWSPQRVPNSTDNAIIDAAGTYTVTAATSEIIQTLSMAKSATLSVTGGTFAVTKGSGIAGLAGTINIADGTVLTLAGPIVNSGTINENAVSTFTELQVTGTGATLSGKGHINLSNNASNLLFGTGLSVVLTNLDNVIAGAGTIGAGQMTLVNDGVINANKATPLVIDTGTSVVTNAGTLEATTAGNFVLNGVVDNSAGTISAIGAGAVVSFVNSILGGTLSTSGGGVIRTTPGSAALDGRGLHPVTNTGTVQVADATTLSLLGSISNAGTIVLASTGDGTNLQVGSPLVTLSGKGKIVLAGTGASQIFSGGAGFALGNVDNTISGAGQINVALTNSGTISADQLSALSVNSSSLTNTGTMQATNKGGLVIQNSTVMNAGGRIQATTAGSHVDLATSTVMGGSLHTAAGGVIDTSGGGTLDGLSAGAVTSDATILVKDNENLTLLGTISNAGTISQAAVSGVSDIRLGSPIVTLTGGGKLLMSNNANNRIYGNAPNFRLVNVNNTISGAGQLGVGQMRLTNQAAGVINANQAASKTDPGSLTLNTGQALITNAGLLEATNTGGLVLQSFVLNVGGTILATGAGAHVDLSNASIIGGTLSSAAGGVADVISGAGTLDGLSAGPLTNAATIVVEDATSLTLLGTIANTGRISDAATASTANIFIGGAATTLTGKGSVLLTNNVGNQIIGSNFLSQLVNVDNTISGAGQLGVGTSLGLVNQATGTINANQALALTLNTTGDVINAGLMEATNTAVGNGGFIVQNTAIDNATGTIQAVGANAHINLSAGTIVGGTLSSSGGGVIQTTSNSVLDGLNDGALNNTGIVKVTDSTALQLLGTINNTGTINVNATTAGITDLQIGSATVTLTGGGLVTLSNNTGNRIYGTVASNRLVNVNNTIAGAGQLGVGQLALTNSGTINANATKSLTIDLGSQTGLNQSKGLIESSAAGGLTIAAGLITNSGTMLASNGSKLTFLPSAVLINNASGVLTGGIWQASGSGSAVSLTGGPVTVDHATIILSGAGSAFRAGDGNTFTTLEQSLTTVAAGGTLEVLAARPFTSTKALADNGTIQLGGGTLTATGLSVGAGAHLTGFGVVTPSSKTIANAGTIEANGGTLSTASVISGAGALRADAGAILLLSGVGDSTGSVVNNGTVTLAANATLNVTGSIDAASTGIFQLNAASLLTVGADLGAANKMNFLGTGELVISAAAQFGLNVGQTNYKGPLLQHFVANDHILLNDISATGLTPNYSAATGLLQLNNGSANVATLAFDNATLGAGAFHVTADAQGHALISHS
jgi:large repetitive protein